MRSVKHHWEGEAPAEPRTLPAIHMSDMRTGASLSKIPSYGNVLRGPGVCRTPLLAVVLIA